MLSFYTACLFLKMQIRPVYSSVKNKVKLNCVVFNKTNQPLLNMRIVFFKEKYSNKYRFLFS